LSFYRCKGPPATLWNALAGGFGAQPDQQARQSRKRLSGGDSPLYCSGVHNTLAP